MHSSFTGKKSLDDGTSTTRHSLTCVATALESEVFGRSTRTSMLRPLAILRRHSISNTPTQPSAHCALDIQYQETSAFLGLKELSDPTTDGLGRNKIAVLFDEL